MDPHFPSYLLTFNIVFLPLSLLSGLGLVWLGHARAGRGGLAIPVSISAFLIAWFVIAILLGRADVYASGPGTTVPTLPFGLFIPLGLGLWVAHKSAHIHALIDALPLSWLIAAQYYRAVGAVFLVLLAGGHLPWEFAAPAGIGDVLTGVFAIITGFYVARAGADALPAARFWNLFGIFDLVVAVTMGTLTSPGITGMLSQDAPNALITTWPLVMVPTFAVPLSLILHGLTARKIALAERTRTARQVA